MTSEQPPRLSSQYGFIVDGTETFPEARESIPVTDPATETPFTKVAAATSTDVDDAVTVAATAFEEWRRWEPKRRGRLLQNIAESIRASKDRLARIETRENGKPLSDARQNVERCARHFEYYGGLADKVQGDSIPLGDDYIDYTVREPVGVTGHIVPWNVPIYLFGRSVAPALATGNTAVVKPAEETPLGALEVTKLTHEAGLPDGVLNVVPGHGNEAGAALSEHSDVESVTFTGSTTTGRAVGKSAIDTLSDVHLELGGKSPNVVFPDADIKNAIDETIKGIFSNAGQVCSAGSRLLVHEDIHDSFVSALVEATEELTVGPGVEESDMGPLVSESHMKTVLEYIEVGREEVGDPVCGGEALTRDGYFVEPTIFDGVSNDMQIAQEEIFGPVLSVIEFEDETEAVRLANDTDYGLVAGIFTENFGRAQRFARDVDAGQIYINEWFAGGNETPFGGFKQSGVGRENGVQALQNYTQLKNVCARIE